MGALDDMIDALAALEPSELEKRVASEVAKSLETSLRASISAGKGPDGTPWAPRKADGARAFADAAKSLAVKVLGRVVRATISTPEVYGHYGFKGAPPRPMLPKMGGELPAEIAKMLDAAFAKVVDRVLR